MLKKLFSRFTFVALAIILVFTLDVLVIVGLIWLLSQWLTATFPAAGPWIALGMSVLSWIVVFLTALHAANRDMVPETKIPWILCIVFFNVFGVAIYAVFSSHRPNRRMQKKSLVLSGRAAAFERTSLPERFSEETRRFSDVGEALMTVNPSACIYGGTKTEYFPVGEDFRDRLLEDLERAEKYIFMEYFIIEKGEFWNAVLDVLARKVKQGVEVRFMYDDIGCMGRVHLAYHRKIQKAGIRCVKFNPFVPVVTNVHNNRDHRKITVIDGKVGYTGGINLADEYVNIGSPFGHWKDTAVRLEGEGVKGLLLMFLKLYNLATRGEGEDFAPYIPETYERFEGEGFVQPYGSGPRPVYPRSVGEDVYINIINAARDYVWIMTPYLIIDYRMRESLILAAERGVDVRIIVPHIPDKKLAFALTRSNYLALIRGGVKLYEYTPGFVHAKGFLADDRVGVVGTINLDYRSFIHHYEDAVLMYKTRALAGMKADMEQTFAVSRLQTPEDAKKNVVWRWVCEIAKLFAPLF